jgi:ABC-type phosphate transport system substrate-binding protein
MKSIKAFLLTCFAFCLYCGAAEPSHAEMVIVMNAKSAVTNLDKDRIAAIFLGKTATFPDGNQAIPIEQMVGTAVHEEFHYLITEKSVSQLKAYWAKIVFSGNGNPPKEVANSAEVVKLISNNPNMIGYIEKSAMTSSVKQVFPP